MNFKNNDPFFNMFEDLFEKPLNYGRRLRNENETNNTNRNISENVPSTNIVETKGDYQFELSTPGFDKENIKVTLDNSTLTIRGERVIEGNGDRDYLTKEFYSQKFSRTFNVPEGIVLDEIYAKVENGITTLFLPKEKLGKTNKINTHRALKAREIYFFSIIPLTSLMKPFNLLRRYKVRPPEMTAAAIITALLGKKGTKAPMARRKRRHKNTATSSFVLVDIDWRPA